MATKKKTKKKYPPKMTGQQLKTIREKKLKVTQTELARNLWMSEKAGHRTVCAYENGERSIRGPIQLCLAYMQKYGPLTPP